MSGVKIRKSRMIMTPDRIPSNAFSCCLQEVALCSYPAGVHSNEHDDAVILFRTMDASAPLPGLVIDDTTICNARTLACNPCLRQDHSGPKIGFPASELPQDLGSNPATRGSARCILH